MSPVIESPVIFTSLKFKLQQPCDPLANIGRMLTGTKLAHCTNSLAASLAQIPMVHCSFAGSHIEDHDQFFLDSFRI